MQVARLNLPTVAPETVSAVVHATGVVAGDSDGSGTEASSDEEGGVAGDSASDSSGASDTSSDDDDGGESDSSGADGAVVMATIPTMHELVAMQSADPRLQALRHRWWQHRHRAMAPLQ